LLEILPNLIQEKLPIQRWAKKKKKKEGTTRERERERERGAMSNQDTTPKMHKWGLISRLFDLL
jgi:hypothetical protein